MRTGISMLLYMVCVPTLHVNTLVAREGYGEVKFFQTSDTYDVESTVMLNDVSRADKEVAYKIKASLAVEPVWKHSEDAEFLIKFELESPHLLSRGKHVNADFLFHKSIWDSYPHSTFYAHWKNGIIQTPYLDLNELPEVVNYKRSLISLFQFQVLDGETNETDISGNCRVIYESLSINIIRKIKSGCEEWGSAGSTRRVTRYTFDAGLRELHAEEVHAAGGIKARAWTRLLRTRSRPAAPPASPPAAPPAPPAPLAPTALYEPPSEPRWTDDNPLELESVMSMGDALWGAGEAGAGGTVEAALAALSVLPALCSAPASRLTKLLDAQTDTAALRALVSALGSCGSAGAHAAVSALLQLSAGSVGADSPALPGLAEDYLAAFALASEPQESVVEDVLNLSAWPAASDSGVSSAEAEESVRRVAESALCAGAAAARRLPPAAPPARAVRHRLRTALAACRDDTCRSAHVRALGNLASEDAIELLLDHAESDAAAVAVEALAALESMPTAALQRRALTRLQGIALSGRPHTVRAAALDLLLRLSAPAPFGLTRFVYLLHERAGVELRRLLWQRLAALATTHEPVAQLLGMLPPELNGWHTDAAPATSSVLTRAAGAARLAGGAAGGAWRAELDSVQVASGGMLRRGIVRLTTLAPDNTTDDTLAVELQASGLHSLSGGSDGEGESEEEVRAALHLSVAGVRLPPLTLFDGQGELLRHVWAGTGSAPTSVLRALRPLPPAAAALRLLDGAALHCRRRAAAALALDAHAQVSLWSRNARAALELRGGVAAISEAVVAGAGGRLRAASHVTLAPRLRIAADLDFYDGVALCVRPRVEDAPQHSTLALNATLGADGRGVRRRRSVTLAAPGRTLSLGALNDAACCTLGSPDE